MIGFFGVLSKTGKIDQHDLKVSFGEMGYHIDHNDFELSQFIEEKFCIGLCVRKNGNNKDLSLKRINDSLIMGFNGYGKFKGERSLHWANSMVDRVADLFLKKGITELTSTIQGSFEIIIFDESNLYIISDRFGSRRLFYADTENSFVFAPEIGQILSSKMIKKTKNIETAIQILVSGYPLDDSTLANGIYRFPYATLLQIQLYKPVSAITKRYWNLPTQQGKINQLTNDLVSEFSFKLSQSIEQLSMLDSNSVVQLSGGIDSRAIACYLSKFQALRSLTYDSKQEAQVAKRVCLKVPAEYHYYNNKILHSPSFQDDIKPMIDAQRTHAVVNQYFFAPMIKDYLNNRPEITSIYDGVLMDEEFSGLTPVNYYPFDLNKFVKTYGGSSHPIIEAFTKVKQETILDIMNNIFGKIGDCDDYFRCQTAYFSGRLRTYVMEAIWSKESYGYVLKPGLDYDLLDFAYLLDPKLRRGSVYLEALENNFPEVMKIKYLNSYLTREETISEKVFKYYESFRGKLSNLSRGYVCYFPYQLDYYFLKMGHVNDYERYFSNSTFLPEIFTLQQKKDIFEMIKKKNYFISLFQRILFLEKFYECHAF